jgi:Fe-S cluster assembly protein SufB
LENVTSKEYEFGFTTNIESDKAPAGLNEDIIRLISSKKNEPQWLLDWRLEAFTIFQKMTEPEWAHVKYEKPNLQAISFYAAPKQKKVLNSLDEMDPELRKTMEKLGISVEEQKRLSGVAVDFVMDSVSVATSFKEKLILH